MRYFASIFNIMSKLIQIFLFLLCVGALQAQTQEPVTPTDTTIYDFVEQSPIPMMARCVQNVPVGWTLDSIRNCSQYALLSVISNNIRYPEEARQKDIQGTVVVSFVVEVNGRISNIKVIRDIGGGCGAEALRVLEAVDEAGLRWQPGFKAERKPVRVRQTLPLRFKLQTALPYYISKKGDTIYTSLDKEAQFRGGIDSLVAFVKRELKYPKSQRDSCKTGIIEMALVVRNDGMVELDNQINFSSIGLDFEWESLQLANKTKGYWTPALYDGKPVNTIVPLRAVFTSKAPRCKTANANFEKAVLLGEEAANLLDQSKPEEAIVKLNEALKLHPNNTEFLYYRGTAYLNLNKRTEACTDYNLVKKMLGVTWFESIRKLMCGF